MSDIPLAAYKQSITNNTLLTRVVMGLSVVVVLLAVAIIMMMPLKEIQLEIVEFYADTNRFVKISKAGDDLTTNEVLIGKLLRTFVKDRETIDKQTESDRYARVFAMSSADLQQKFRSTYGDKKSLFYRRNFKRSIKIIRDDSLTRGIHQVEFETSDSMDDKPGTSEAIGKPKVNYWVATISYHFESQEKTYEEALFNPVGIIVHEYSLSKRK